MCGLFLFVNGCGSATEATATAAATTIATAVTTAVATATTIATAVAATSTAMAASATGQAVDAGAGGVRLTAGANRFAVGQVQARKLRGFQGVDVAWQLVAVFSAMVLATLSTSALTGSTSFWTRATRCGTALAITTVVKTGIATLFLTASTVAPAFAAAIALAFKARCDLGAIAA